MTLEITPDLVYTSIGVFLLVMQIYQHIQLDKTKREVDKIWQQLSTWNTMVAMKLLENQKELDKLNEKNKTDGLTKKI